jgi:hypothetical protein
VTSVAGFKWTMDLLVTAAVRALAAGIPSAH